MRYITGIHALNLPCSLETCGDWHQSALKWEDVTWADTEKMLFGDYGIEQGHRIPKHNGTYPVANHIRALLDLLQIGNFAVAQGMNEDFICNEKYDDEVFNKVAEMKKCENWHKIDAFMGKEYKMKWFNFRKENLL